MSDSSLVIRPATTADLKAVLALYAQPEMDDGAVLPMPDAERLFARFSDYPDYTLWTISAISEPVRPSSKTSW